MDYKKLRFQLANRQRSCRHIASEAGEQETQALELHGKVRQSMQKSDTAAGEEKDVGPAILLVNSRQLERCERERVAIELQLGVERLFYVQGRYSRLAIL